MWKALFRSSSSDLNLRFKSGGGAQIVRVIGRPGLWMSPEELAKLVDDLRGVVAALGIGDLEYGVLSGNKDRLDHAVLTVIYDAKTEKAIAFNALSIMECELRGKSTEVLHLGLVAVDPNYRAKGMSWLLYGFTCFLLYFRNLLRPIWVSNVTQVPAIIGMTTEGFVDIFPSPTETSRRSFDHLQLARQIMKSHRHVFGVGQDASFDEERFVIMNAYTGGSDNLKKTFAQAPKHREERYNEFCRTQLDYDRGDDIIQLGRIQMPAMANYMIHSVPKGSWMALFWTLLFALISALLLPVFQWLSPSKSMGVLRPWVPAKSQVRK